LQCNPGLDSKHVIIKLLLKVIILGSLHMGMINAQTWVTGNSK
jgi:hypothetical protein